MALEDIAKNLTFVSVPDLEYPAWPRINASKKTMDEFHKRTGEAIDLRDTIVRPGAILRLKSGELKLVGDVNANLGVCDDCVDFTYSDIVEVAYLYDECDN